MYLSDRPKMNFDLGSSEHQSCSPLRVHALAHLFIAAPHNVRATSIVWVSQGWWADEE